MHCVTNVYLTEKDIHMYCSRWLPVHIRDITTFAAKQSEVPPKFIICKICGAHM